MSNSERGRLLVIFCLVFFAGLVFGSVKNTTPTTKTLRNAGIGQDIIGSRGQMRQDDRSKFGSHTYIPIHYFGTANEEHPTKMILRALNVFEENLMPDFEIANWQFVRDTEFGICGIFIDCRPKK